MRMHIRRIKRVALHAGIQEQQSALAKVAAVVHPMQRTGFLPDATTDV